jgi:hypothetical protein
LLFVKIAVHQAARASRSTLSSTSRASVSRLRGARFSDAATHASMRSNISGRSIASVPG